MASASISMAFRAASSQQEACSFGCIGRKLSSHLGSSASHVVHRMWG
jgi:hypothetical protein